MLCLLISYSQVIHHVRMISSGSSGPSQKRLRQTCLPFGLVEKSAGKLTLRFLCVRIFRLGTQDWGIGIQISCCRIRGIFQTS